MVTFPARLFLCFTPQYTVYRFYNQRHEDFENIVGKEYESIGRRHSKCVSSMRLNPLPRMPIFGSSNSAVKIYKDMMAKRRTKWGYSYLIE